MLATHELPDDIDALKRLVLDQQTRLIQSAAHAKQLEHDVQVREAQTLALRTEIETLKLLIAKLRRLQFGRSAERFSDRIAQLELILEDLEATQAGHTPSVQTPAVGAAPAKPIRRPLPDHLARETVVHAPACDYEHCGAAMQKIGEDIAEMLEYVPARFKVIRHVRPKYRCGQCQRIVQVDAPSRPIARGLAGPGLLAHVLVSKYCDHQPLYRQSQIYAREGVELDRSTLADWVGQSAALLDPLVQALGRYVMSAAKLHADDTPVPVLAPGQGKTKTGRLWTYVRDDRPAGDHGPPAVLFRYSPDRKGEHAAGHLAPFSGVLQADGYSGFERLYQDGRILEAACFAHVRRKFFDLYEATGSPLAAQALQRISALYEIEAQIRGKSAPERCAARQAHAGPLLEQLKAWLEATLGQISNRSTLAGAIRYALSRWEALLRYRDDGRIEIDNNAAERALRAVATACS